jgi:plastocyanin
VLTIAVAGCGQTHSVGSSRTLHVGVTEYRIRPQSVRVSAGSLTIIVHNYGRLTHNLDVSQNGRSAGSTHPIPPGESAELALYLTPGTYLMASTIVSDQSLGAYGTLTVTR